VTLSRPAIHALLNGSTALALTIGFIAIRRQRGSSSVGGEQSIKGFALHRLAMGTAFLLSTLFLASYLEYHARVGATRFQGPPTLRNIYLTLLISHSVLAMIVVPLVLTTLGFALRGKYDRHRQWARWTWPLWMYVCVTGVGIYFFLTYGQS
jgi:putative membrane protein